MVLSGIAPREESKYEVEETFVLFCNQGCLYGVANMYIAPNARYETYNQQKP
jgi:hypothetical protein